MKWEWDTHDMCSLALCSLVGFAHIYGRHWISNDVIGVSFSLYGIENLHLASFKAPPLPFPLPLPLRDSWREACRGA